MNSQKIGKYFGIASTLLMLSIALSVNGKSIHKGHTKLDLDLNDRFYQKQLNYKPDDETQAPIGNIVYEIDDDDNQNIYHSSDAIDINPNGGRDSDNVFATANNHDNDDNSDGRHQSAAAKYTDRSDVGAHRRHHHKNWERGTVRNSKSHRNNHRDNKWQRQNSKLMKHHKLSFGNHNDNGADSDGDGGRRYNKHKAKSRSGYQHHASVIGSGHGHSMTSSASRSIYNSKFKSNPPYIQAHINFFDTSTGDDSLKSNKYETTGIRQSKWPNLSRLQTQLHQEIIEDSLPPYIKKFNRRNKQLINLLEGTVSPNYIQHANRKAAHQQRRQKQRNKWLEENLFEQQRRPAAVTPALPDLLPPVAIISATTTATTTKAKAGTTAAPSSTVHGSNDKTYKYIDKMSNFLLSRNVQSEPNALPGEHLSLSSEEDVDIDSERDERGQFGIAHKREHQQVYPISPKADTFLFHRVAASPKLVGTGLSGNGVAKPRLPFVAITDRRVGEAPQRRVVQPSRNNMSMP